MDELDVIRRAIEEHHRIRADIRLAGEAVNDMEALFNLQQAHAAWGQGSVRQLTEATGRLQATIEGLRKGLGAHFGFEERYLPDIFGKNLMMALILEHDEVRGKLLDCASTVSTGVAGLQQESLLSFRNVVQQKTSDLSSTMESHASREEIILRMLEKSLERQRQAKTS